MTAGTRVHGGHALLPTKAHRGRFVQGVALQHVLCVEGAQCILVCLCVETQGACVLQPCTLPRRCMVVAQPVELPGGPQQHRLCRGSGRTRHCIAHAGGVCLEGMQATTLVLCVCGIPV